jgi:hypothetical protein
MAQSHPPIQIVPGALSLSVNKPGCEAHHSPPPTSAEFKKPWIYTFTPQHGVVFNPFRSTVRAAPTA